MGTTMHAEEHSRLPDLPDMMEAGMSLTEALAFWSRMMNSSTRNPEFWWMELKVAHLQRSGLISSLEASGSSLQ